MERNWSAELLRKEFRLAEQKGIEKVAELMIVHKAQIHPNFFVSYLREYTKTMKHTQNADIVLDLINQLIYDPFYNKILHGCLVQFYTEVVRSLYYQNLNEKLLRAKVFRKMWLPKLHPQLYADLREIINRQVKVDLDYIEQSDAIQHIAQYYKSHVKLSPEQIAIYLPQYFQPLRPQCPPTVPQPDQMSLLSSLTEKMVNMSMNDSDIEESLLRLSVKQTNQNPFVVTSLPLGDNKRARDFSVQTVADEHEMFRTRKARITDDHVEFQTQVSTVKQHFDTLEKCRAMRSMLHNLNPYECKQCGQKFSREATRDEHQTNHMTQRLKEFKDKEKGKSKPNMLVSRKIWINENENQSNTIFLHFIQQDHHHQKRFQCSLCHQQIKFCFRNDKWMFINAIRVGLKLMAPRKQGEIRDQKDDQLETKFVEENGKINPYKLMHLTCFNPIYDYCNAPCE